MWSAAILVSFGSLAAIFAALTLYSRLGGTDTSFSLAVGLGFLALLAAVLIPPIVPLLLTLTFLESPLPPLLDNRLSAYITTGLLAWAALGCFVSVSRPRGKVSHPLLGRVWLFGVYGLLCAIRGFLAGNPADYLVGDLFQVEEFAVIFILVCRLAVDEKSSRRLLGFTLAFTFLTMLWQLGAHVAGVDLNGTLSFWEGAGSGAELLRTINLDALFVLVVLVGLYVALTSFWHRLAVWLLFIPTMANVLLSLTRGVWAASLIALFVAAWLLTRNERTKLLRGVTVVALSLAMLVPAWRMVAGATDGGVFDAVKERLSFALVQVEEGSQGSVGVETRRFVEVSTIGGQILSSPLLGRGLGALFSIDSGALVSSDPEATIDYHFIHNLYLLIAFRMGLIGLAIFCWILYSYFRKALLVCAKLPFGTSRALTCGLFAGVAGEVALSLTSPTMLNHPTCGLAACAMALTFRFGESQGPNS
jgi:O-antigen ligase